MEKNSASKRVAVLGASANPEKYSYMAVKLLREKSHAVFPVHPALSEIEGLKVFHNLKEVPGPIDTVSVYLNPAISSKIGDEILASKPKRIIFNPGAENPELAARAEKQGIQALEACTLVMLKTEQF